MRKAYNFLNKVIHRVKLSFTIKLPLINVTLAPSIIQQPLFGCFFVSTKNQQNC